jgi:CRP-like cAMP-binding protein
MFVVMAGTVEVVGRDQASGKSVKVCTFGPGDIIGELEFLNHHKAVADVVAVDKVKTGSLHREHFEACMGPVKDFLRHNAEANTKYQYYNTITHDDGFGNKLLDFKFGDGGDDPFGGGGGAFNSAFGGFGDDGDGESNSQEEGSVPPPTHTKVRKQGVSDDVMEEDSNWKPPVFKKSDKERELLYNVLKENPLFRSLEKHDFDVVVSAMERHSYKDGVLILEQGGEGGSHFHVIEDGTVEIIRDKKLIVTFGRGQGFGEMELMYYQPCVATVKARGEVVTWALDRTTYKRLVMQISIKRRNLYTELLGGVEFLDRMTEYEKGQLADALTPVTFQKGESLIRRGERNEWMFIIVSGTVEVLGVPEGAQADDMEIAATRHICFLERGACVGELEFLNQHAAVANCTAFDEVRACTLHRDHFELCMGPIMDVLRKTVRQDKYEYYNSQLEDMRAPSHQRAGAAGPTRRARTHAVSAETAEKDDGPFEAPKIAKDPAQLEICSLTVRKCPLFSGLTGDDRQVVIDALEPTSHAASHIIFKEGEVPEDNHWYIVSEGTVEQVREGNHVVAKFAPGQSFGELELMYTTPAQVTTRVSSSGAMKGFRLDRRTYRRIVMQVVTERRRLYRELLTGVPFASALTEQQHVVLADALTPIHFAPGDHLVRVGEQNEWMYILADGVVEVFGKDGAKVCDLRRGEMVGELEFLNKHAAVANCIAKTHVQACKLHRDHFEMCLGPVTHYINQVLEQPKYAYYKNTVKK